MEKEEGWKQIFLKIIKNRKFQIGLTAVLFLVILISSIMIRTANLPLLVDKTTGQYDLADPDGFYELRVATAVLNGINLDSIDNMRWVGLNLTYAKEMLPGLLAFVSRTGNFNIRNVSVYYPPVAFGISLCILFALAFYLTKSKFFALLTSALLAYSPVSISRTAGGVSSHESLGMIFFFLALLIFIISLNRWKKNYKTIFGYGLATGVCLILSGISWSGASNFVIMILPLSALIYYLFNIDDKDTETKKRFILFNLTWIISSVLLMPLFHYPLSSMYSRFLTSYGLIIPFGILFMVVDYCFEKYAKKKGQSKYRIMYSLLMTFIVSIIGLMFLGKNPLQMVNQIYTQLLFPFGSGRVGLTVAYFQQPYLTDVISQYSPVVFWLFFIGIIFLGLEVGKEIKKLKNKVYFMIIWIIFISGMLFSRYSSTSLFNGTNFISQLFYLGSFCLLIFYLFYLYFKERFKIDNKSLFLFCWMIVMLISLRSAVRVLFVIIPFVLLCMSFLILKSYEYAKKSKDETLRYILYGISIIALIIAVVFLFGNPLTKSTGAYQISSLSAAGMGPITNDQWQYSMAWVRDNTSPNDIFVSWWDYGYLIQYLGQRPTVADGGNANVFWDHMIGRYLLTTPEPETALSFMKSHDVSYLLIDPTDFGKYSAYSSIGSDESGQDRFSWLPVMLSDPSQTQETNSSTIRAYSGGTYIDEDIIYNDSGKQVFLPSGKAAMLGTIVETANSGNQIASFKQPEGVFYYNGQQIRIPLRHIYFNGKLLDFKTGIDATIMIIPSISTTSVDSLGAVIYLSPKTENSLFAQLYLMNDPENKYPTISVAHSEEDVVVTALKQQGINVGEFVYYNGFRGPLKIWKVNYPSNILFHKEFLATSGTYGEFDNLTFVK